MKADPPAVHRNCCLYRILLAAPALATLLTAPAAAFAITRTTLSAPLPTLSAALPALATLLAAAGTLAATTTLTTTRPALPTLLASAWPALPTAGTALTAALPSALTAFLPSTRTTLTAAFLTTLTIGHRRLLGAGRLAGAPCDDSSGLGWLHEVASPWPKWIGIMSILRNQNRERHHPRHRGSDCQPGHSQSSSLLPCGSVRLQTP
jgi:hypothetical protein